MVLVHSQCYTETDIGLYQEGARKQADIKQSTSGRLIVVKRGKMCIDKQVTGSRLWSERNFMLQFPRGLIYAVGGHVHVCMRSQGWSLGLICQRCLANFSLEWSLFWKELSPLWVISPDTVCKLRRVCNTSLLLLSTIMILISHQVVNVHHWLIWSLNLTV